MNCGNHQAQNCAACPQGNGATWCNGECEWINDQCVSGTWEPLGDADCWYSCGRKGGLCQNFCGRKGYCCRKGYRDERATVVESVFGFGLAAASAFVHDCPVLASERASPLRHTCVNFGKFDCTDTFKNRVASFEYNYYPGYWLAPYSGGFGELQMAGISWATSSEVRTNKKFQWILHDCGDSVCMESKRQGWEDYLFGSTSMIHDSDLSDGSDLATHVRIFCDSCNRGGLENTTFNNCEIIIKAIENMPNPPYTKISNRRLLTDRHGVFTWLKHGYKGDDSWFRWRIESPPTRVYWKEVFNHCNGDTTNTTVKYTMTTSITTSTSTTTEVNALISLGYEAGKLLEPLTRTVGGELGGSFKWSRTHMEQMARSETTEISTRLEPGMRWIVSQAVGEAGWTSIITEGSKSEMKPC